ncbi:zinc finger X-chromosomal -like isoform X1 [Labeo rohita]|uniref:Zinc finger X-chromosomal-like isoform X1 n=1 Tax=Labeo rohita TaxID=84645 RepID=A0A498L7M7_LABRO|nr:zinc finger X-chromosomal -like isoform X1 [Labeo rohita]
MDEDVTALSLHSHEPKIIFHGAGDGEDDEVVVELQESVLVSDVEGEKIAVHGLAHEELVIQEAIEDVVAEYVPCTDDDEALGTIAVETCVMSPDDVALDEEGLQVDVVTDAQVQEDPDTCGDYLMISLDEAGKVVSDEDAKVTIEGTLEDSEDVEKDDEGQEVIKVYIIKAHPEEEDLGGTVDIGDAELDVDETVELVDSSGMPIREKMVYMSMDEANQNQDDINVAKITDEVYMEVVVGGEDPGSAQRAIENVSLSKDFMPVAWAAAYGGEESESCENRNGAASALLHVDESDMIERLGRQRSKNKSKKRSELRHVQTAIIIGPYGQPLTVYPCMLCGKKFKSRGFLKRHTKNHHQDVVNRKKYQCTDCDFTTNKKASLHNHMEIHTLSSKAPFECEVCGKEFHQQAALFSHRLQHHHRESKIQIPPPTTKMHKCKFCEYETAEQGLLNRHLLAVHMHTKEQQAFPDKKGLKKTFGLGAHGGKKILGGAGLSKGHRERRVYQCQYCDYSTGDASGFKRHVISIHTKDYPHRCDFCSKGFRRPSEKNQHIMRHHKDLMPSM